MTLKKERPAGEGGPSAMSFSGDEADGNAKRRRKPSLLAVIHHQDGDRELEVFGRDAWCLMALVAAGSAGCTPLNNPAPRWSCYVARLRAKGVPIETVRERHGGPYRGTHGRYRLACRVTLRDMNAPGEAA